MKSKANWLAFFFVLLSLNYPNACTCNIYGHPFCAVVGTGHKVILAEVINQQGYSDIEVDIIENISNVIAEDTIKILGQDGLNCGAEMNQFGIGDTLILGIFNFQTQNAMTGEMFDYYLDGCNHNFLRYSQGMVTGSINYDSSDASYEDFKNGIAECLDATLSVSENDFDSTISFYPNPTGDYLNVESEINNIQEISIYDLNGRMVYRENRIGKKQFKVDLNLLDAGIYITRIKSDKGMLVNKLSKI